MEELDHKLGRPSPAPAEPARRPALPTWLALLALTFLLAGVGSWFLKPTRSTCEFSESVCAIEDLDIDALLLTIPDAELFSLLPSIDEVDPDDEMTAGEIFALDVLDGIDPESLITPEELERVLDLLD